MWKLLSAFVISKSNFRAFARVIQNWAQVDTKESPSIFLVQSNKERIFLWPKEGCGASLGT